MPEQGSQFTCPQCGEPQFTADFGFERHYHQPNDVRDPCVFCGESTAPAKGITLGDLDLGELFKTNSLINSKFVNRLPGTWQDPNDPKKTIEGYACADCMSSDCKTCGKPVRLDEEVVDKNGEWHHHGCLNPKDADEYFQDCECDDCEKWRK